MQKKSAYKIAILGAGIGGLATAALLAKDGHDVTVFEKNATAGGRASQWKHKGFSFDLGPSWYLMPDVFDRFFADVGTTAAKELKLKRMEHQYRIFWDDGQQVDIVSDLDTNLKTFEKIEPGSSAPFLRYLAESKLKYDLSVAHFLYRNMDTLFDLLTPVTMRYGLSLDLFTSMDRYVRRFFTTEKMQQLIQYTLVFLGGAPVNTPALYSLMSHLDFNLGLFYPMGGFSEVPKAFVRIAKRHGVKFEFNAPIEQLVTNSGAITHVVVKGKKLKFDAVISNGDYKHTEDLLSDQSTRNYSVQSWEKKTLTPSAFLLYLGVKGKLPELEHHNLYFGKKWTDHFKTIFENPSWPVTPSLYINMPSKTDPTVAPKGHENLMILVPISAGLPESEAWRESYAQFILSYMKETMGLDLKDRIVCQRIFSVTDFEKAYNSFKGNALGGLAHTLFQSAIWRPSNKSKKLNNLFFAGANTVPGIGVPISLISAELARERIKVWANSRNK